MKHSTQVIWIKREEKWPMECSFGQIIQNTRVNGLTTKQMAKVNCGVQMVTLMKETGRMIKRMVLALSNQMTERSAMLEIGKMICTTVKELKVGQMAQGLMVILHKEERTVLGPISGQTVHSILETGQTTRCGVKEHTSGLMEGNTSASG